MVQLTAADERGRLLPDWATLYYVAGRMAARAFLAPIYGNLSGVVGSVEMKQKYRHDLKKLWRRYKEKETDPALDQFDSTIRALHKFEDIRYPDKFAARGAIVSVAWKPSHAVKVRLEQRQPPKYEVFISDVDRLVIEILKRASLNPKFFAVRLRRPARGALRYQNPHARRWLTKRTD